MPRSLRSPKTVRRRRKRLALRISLVVLILCILIGGPALLSRASFWKINSVQVTGNTVVSTDAITQIVDNLLTTKSLFILSRSNILLYPHNQIASTILKTFPRISAVDIKVSSMHSITVVVTERQPTAIWCQTPDTTACFFVDSNGLVFDSAPDFSPNTLFMYTGRLDDNPIGEYYLSSDLFTKLQGLIAQFRVLGLDPIRVDYDDDDSYTVTNQSGGLIIFSLSDDADKIASNLASVLNDPTLNIFQNNTLSVYSIDLRYGNKVILKKKGN